MSHCGELFLPTVVRVRKTGPARGLRGQRHLLPRLTAQVQFLELTYCEGRVGFRPLHAMWARLLLSSWTFDHICVPSAWQEQLEGRTYLYSWCQTIMEREL